MKRIDNIISDIQTINRENDFWLYDDKGNIRDDVICGSVIDFLNGIKQYEVDTTDNAINIIVDNADKRWNTYNWNANIDHHIDVAEKVINGHLYMVMMVHRYGDVRGNYTDRFLIKFDDEYDWFDVDERMQYKTFGYNEDMSENRYCADIDIFSESYNVYDWKTNNNIGEFYETEVEELMKVLEG